MDQGTDRPLAPSAAAAIPTDAAVRYRAQVEHVYNKLSLTGLPERDPRLNQLPLDGIFVTLSVEIDVVQPGLPFDGGRLAESDGEQAGLDLRKGADILRERAPQTLRLSVGEALKRYRRLVIVGAPGGGKTTLLRWLAATFAAQRQGEPDRLGPGFETPYLPVVLELRRFADRFGKLTEQPATFDLAAEASAFIAQDVRFAGTPRAMIHDAITAGRCLILLDGLDEIADRAARGRLIEAIEALCFDPQQNAEGNLCLLTTRPHGFANLALGAGFQTATVRPFEPGDVATFIRTWYRVAYAEDALAAEVQELISAIRDNERVAELASNPLLCTIIAIVFRNNRVLPERRVELYLKCCEALLDTWERNKDIKSSGLIGGFGWQLKVELLAALAYWMHGETERFAAAEDAVVERITEALEADQLAKPGWAEDEARRFVETIRDRSGLLRGRGDGTLEFSHRTFQEYLAARHLAALQDEAMLDGVMSHLHEAWWEEVHLLLFGHLGGGKENSGRVERLTLCILDAPRRPLPFLMPPQHRWLWPISPGRWFPAWECNARLGRILGRDLALAIGGYYQCAVTARSSALTERLTQEIETTLTRWRRNRNVARPAFQKIVKSVRQDGSHLATVLNSTFVAAIQDSNSGMRSWAARALGSAAGSDPAVVPALLAALRDSEWTVRGSAAEALGSAAGSDPAVVPALLAALRDSDPNVRSCAVRALGSAAGSDPAVVPALLAALRDSDPNVRSCAVRALGSAAGSDPAVVPALLAVLQDGDSDVRSKAVRALGSAAGRDPAVVPAPLAALRDSEWTVRASAAEALGSAAGSDPAVVPALLAALRDRDGFVRSSAAQALGSAVGSDPAVVPALLAALRDSDSDVRSSAAEALGSAAGSDPAVVPALLAALRDSDSDVRSSAAEALGSAAGSDPAVVPALLAVLQDSDSDVRSKAVRALGSAAGSDPAVVPALLAALRDSEGFVRSRAALALGSAAGSDPAVVPALLAVLQDSDSDVRSKAVRALGSAAGSDPAVVPALLAVSQDSESNVRSWAAQSLGSAVGYDPAVVPALLAALRDSAEFVRSRAALALGSAAGSSDPAVVPALLAALRERDRFVRNTAARALGSAAGSDPAVVPALLAALRDSEGIVRSSAAEALGSAAGSESSSRLAARGTTAPATVPPILPELWRAANRDSNSFDALSGTIARVTEGHQLPGYQWVPLTVRHQQRALQRKLAIGIATALTIALAIWFGAGWFAGLPADGPTRLFLTAIPAVSGLLALLWGFWLVVRGEKRTLWG